MTDKYHNEIVSLEGTQFNHIPILNESSDEEIKEYEKNPVLVNLYRYSINLSSGEIREALLQECSNPVELAKALDEQNIGLISKLVDSRAVLKELKLRKFEEFRIANEGNLPLNQISDVTIETYKEFTISPIFYGRLDTELREKDYPIVKLSSIEGNMVIYVPVNKLKEMWLDEDGFINFLKLAK